MVSSVRRIDPPLLLLNCPHFEYSGAWHKSSGSRLCASGSQTNIGGLGYMEYSVSSIPEFETIFTALPNDSSKDTLLMYIKEKMHSICMKVSFM